MNGGGATMVEVYTVQGQGLALLALGLARPNPKRARVGPEFYWAGPALIGSRATADDLAQPGPTWGRPGLTLFVCIGLKYS